MDSCLFFCHSQTSKNLDFRVKEPHLSQPKRRNNGGFRLDWRQNRSLLPKRGATLYFENVRKSGGLCLKTVSPARIAGRCERRWSHRFIPHLFRPPGSRRCRLHISHFAAGGKARSFRRTVSPPLSTSLGQRAVLQNSGHTASTRLCRGRGGVRMPPRHQKGDTGRHRGNNGEKRRSRPRWAAPTSYI